MIFEDIDWTVADVYEQLAALRQIAPASRLVLISAVAFQSLPFDPFAKGADAFLEKPCDPQVILRSARKFRAPRAPRAACAIQTTCPDRQDPFLSAGSRRRFTRPGLKYHRFEIVRINRSYR